MENILNEALAYGKQDFKVFPLIPKQKRPIKDWSYLKATNDPEELFNIFCSEKPYSIGINLKEADLIVLDLDRHTNVQDGIAWLTSKINESLENDCVVYTPRNGLHIYFKLNVFEVPNKLELADGVEILTDFCFKWELQAESFKNVCSRLFKTIRQWLRKEESKTERRFSD